MLLSSISSLAGLLLSLIFILIFKEKNIAKIYGESIPNILIALVLMIFIYKHGRIFVKKEYIVYCFSLTLPLLFHGLGGVIFSQFDRIMLQKMVGVEELGIYTVTYSLCNILNIIYGALNVTWVPFYYDYKKRFTISRKLYP
jgi:O-antigen/teichoic acid export membrane protein